MHFHQTLKIGSINKMKIKLASIDKKIVIDVVLQNISDTQYNEIIKYFNNLLVTSKVSEAVTDAFLFAVSKCPQANPSDLWWHVIYRHYLSTYSDQSWKRTAGFALEKVFVKFYSPLLKPFGIRISLLTGARARKTLIEMGIANKVGRSKLDVVLEGEVGENYIPFGGLHVKSSLAERIQDDVPASVAMMDKGLWSGFITLDAKAFPPPHGDGVVRGELGLRNLEEGALKRNYFERDGQFDNCYSYNSRTLPSDGPTVSGKRIYSLSFNDPKPDQLMKDIIQHWEKFSK
jgi:hypothetical protein